ncbi:MAG: hypothetical protein SVR08_09950 [Spirochaetota bacterium]|nr:hypothetical protein [Spirochaetota bacterium]
MLEKKFANTLIIDSQKISLSLNKFEKGKKLYQKDLSEFIMNVKRKYKNLALIVIADKKNILIKADRNEKLITSSNTFDKITEGFRNNELKLKIGEKYITKYYDQMKFYIFFRNIPNAKLLIIFPHKLSTKFIIKLFMEIALIVIIITIIISLIYIHDRKTIPTYEKKSKILSDESTKRIPKTKAKRDRDNGKQDIENLNNYCFELFSYISSQYSPESISLSLLNKKTGNLDKIFELVGNAFRKVDFSDIDSMDIDNEVGEELSRSAIMILERGRRLILPIIYENTLIGILNLIRENGLKSKEIKDINTHIKSIAKELYEYLPS